MFKILFIGLLAWSLNDMEISACSVFYYIDGTTGKIYVANNEDFWYDVRPYIQIEPRKKDHLARLWYGWDNFAQGGINEAGLFFDGAVTPEQLMPDGYQEPQGNLGDKILAQCQNTEEAVKFLENNKIALHSGHIMFGDSTGHAVVVEWIDGDRKIIPLTDNRLIMTNFLLSDTSAGNYPCYRYEAIERSLDRLQENSDIPDLKTIGNVIANAVQLPSLNEEGKEGGTLYSTFLNITDRQFVLVYKLDNARITSLDLNEEFSLTRKKKIKLE